MSAVRLANQFGRDNILGITNDGSDVVLNLTVEGNDSVAVLVCLSHDGVRLSSHLGLRLSHVVGLQNTGQLCRARIHSVGAKAGAATSVSKGGIKHSLYCERQKKKRFLFNATLWGVKRWYIRVL